MSIRFSVIIPVYNGERYIANALGSVFAQTFAPYEVIVVDDGSTDGTPRALERFGRSIKTVRTQNRGVSNARNIGMLLAGGTHIAFLDSDDVWFRDKLLRHASWAERFPHAGVFCSNYIMRYPSKGYRLERHFSCPRFHKELASRSLVFNRPLPDPLSLLARRNFIGSPSSCVLSKKAVARIGFFDSALRYAEDYDYWLRCASSETFVLLPEVLVFKRTHSTNATSDFLSVLRGKETVLERGLNYSLAAAAKSTIPCFLTGC